MQALTKIRNDVLDHIAQELVRVEQVGAGWVVSTPIYYPSGSSAVVQVRETGSRFFVTDMGFGYREAEFSGAPYQYRNEAKKIAEATGVRFDDHAFFEIDVTREQLPGAIAVIANCSSNAAAMAVHKLAQKKERDEADRLYQRLVGIFTQKRVVREADVPGSSGTTWRVANIVRDGSRPAIFEPVSKHHTSVFTIATKFHDFALLEMPPKCIAVVKSKEEMHTYLGILAQAGNVIEAAANDLTYERLAEAA